MSANERELIANLGDVPMTVGLRQQGHMETVEQMLREGKLWDEIGEAIGWHGPTARDWWAREVVAVLAELRQEKEDASVCGVVTGGWVESGMSFTDVCEIVRPCAAHPPEAWLTERNRADGAEEALAAVRAELARARAVLGPNCPKCGHYLKAEHRRSFNPPRGEVRYYRGWYTSETPIAGQDYACELWTSDLFTNHPEIAKEMRLC